MAALGFDSSVLSAFARARRLDTLDRLTQAHHRVVTPAVLDELDHGISRQPLLADVRTLRWLEVVRVDAFDELVAFSELVRILGQGRRNIGEASILAWAQIRGGVALIDDRAAVNAARARQIEVRRSLGLVCDGIHNKAMDMEEARFLVDELATLGGARLPCDGATFQAWAESNGLVLP